MKTKSTTYAQWLCNELKRKLRAERSAKTRYRQERDAAREALARAREDFNRLAGESL